VPDLGKERPLAESSIASKLEQLRNGQMLPGEQKWARGQKLSERQYRVTTTRHCTFVEG